MKKLILLIFIISFFGKSIAQISLSATSGLTPDPKAMLDMSSTTKGLLIFRMTSAQRVAIAPNITQIGMTAFELTT